MSTCGDRNSWDRFLAFFHKVDLDGFEVLSSVEFCGIPNRQLKTFPQTSGRRDQPRCGRGMGSWAVLLSTLLGVLLPRASNAFVPLPARWTAPCVTTPLATRMEAGPRAVMLAGKKAAKKVAAVVNPHIEVNKKYPGLKQINKDPAIFTIDNFFDKLTCEKYMALGPAGEQDGNTLCIDSATFGGGATASNRRSTTWFVKYARAGELVKGALQLLPDRVLTNCEEPQIVRYQMGDFFNWHEDALPPDEGRNWTGKIATAPPTHHRPPSSGSEASHELI